MIIIHSSSETGIPLFGLKVAGATVNVDHLLYAWLTYLIDGTMRRKVIVERQRSSLNRSVTASTPRRTKSYARGIFVYVTLCGF